MDIAEKMAADIALAIDGGDWQDAKWFSKFHREAWIKAVQPYADEIERLREKVNELVKERNRYKRVCLKIVGDSEEESDISDFVLYLAKEALKEGE